MVKLYDKGVYLLNGTEIAEDVAEVKAKTGTEVSQQEAAKATMAYHILADHNTSGNMERLQIKFDKLTFSRTLHLWESFRQQGRQAGEIPDSVCPDKLP